MFPKVQNAKWAPVRVSNRPRAGPEVPEVQRRAVAVLRRQLAHAAEHLVMTSAERFSLVYELRAPVELTTGWGEANDESDATDDEEEDGEVDQGSGEESWLERQLRLARVS